MRILLVVSATRSSSGRRHGHAVGGDDLRLESEDVTTLRVDERLDPVHIVCVPLGVRAERVISEGLDTREVLDTSTARVEERLVDHEVVRVAVDEDDRPVPRRSTVCTSFGTWLIHQGADVVDWVFSQMSPAVDSGSFRPRLSFNAS